MEVVPVEMGPENTEDVKKRGNSPFFYLLCKKKTIQMLKKIPHTFVIIGFIILICGVLTWFIPAGEYNYETVSINGIDRSVTCSQKTGHSKLEFSGIINSFKNVII